MNVMMFKKIVGVSVILLLAVVGVNNVNPCSISGGSAAVPLGTTDQELIIPIDLAPESGENIAALQVDVGFDTNDLIFNTMSIGPSAQQADKQIAYASIGADKVRFIIYGINQNVISQGTITNLSFNLSADATMGTSPLVLSNAVVCDPNASLINSTTNDGSVAIEAPGVFGDLSGLAVYPNPFKPSSGHTAVTFIDLAELESIKIYTITGELVKEIKDQTGGMAVWDGTNDKGKAVASGVYLYLIADKGGDKETGRIVVMR